MIQRIQTVYLTFAFISSGVLPFIFYLWKNNQNENIYFMHSTLFSVFFGLSTSLSLLSILNFKKRQSQFVMNRVNIIFNLILLALFVYQSLNLSGETLVSKNGIGIFLPVLTIFLLAIANKAIKKDEDLVKSVDRLR